jgi:peptide/nickel transport system substrate-binding protein
LKFIPQSDLTILDPIVTTVYTARNHGMMVFDTLFGMDSAYKMQPQMLDGFTVEDDGLRWKLTLRDGLLWHDGERVLARDCVASIRRWAVRDGIGSLLMARTDELAALDDRTIQFRLRKPFQILPYALGKISTPICAMMPERLASTDPFKPVSEMVGSGPFRFKADEWVSGSLAVYTKFDRYVPRQEKTTGWTAGGKVVHFERVEWRVSPDDGTSASAMQAGEMDHRGDQGPERHLGLHEDEQPAAAVQQCRDPPHAAGRGRAVGLHDRDCRRGSQHVARRRRHLHARHRHGDRCRHGGADRPA